MPGSGALFGPKPDYAKLKTCLRLALKRLKLLERKKSELALRARREVAECLSGGKGSRAKIRVEHIICEDYLVEALELTEVFCGLLLSRFGLIQQMRGLDEGLSEAISSLLWVAPRLQADVPELRLVADQLMLKYGKSYAQACRQQQTEKISKRLIQKLSVQAPSKVLVEKYLIEIAKIYNVEYEPDPQVVGKEFPSQDLLSGPDDPGDGNNGGACGAETKWKLPEPTAPLPPSGGNAAMALPSGAKGAKGPLSESPPPDAYSDPKLDKMYDYMQNVSGNSQWDGLVGPGNSPPPAYTCTLPNGHIRDGNSPSSASDPRMVFCQSEDDHLPNTGAATQNEDSKSDSMENILPFLPTVPGDPDDASDLNASQGIDFDDLNKRFENLKKRK